MNTALNQSTQTAYMKFSLMADKAYLEGLYRQGAERASRIAGRTLAKVYKKVGFLPR